MYKRWPYFQKKSLPCNFSYPTFVVEGAMSFEALENAIHVYGCMELYTCEFLIIFIANFCVI